MAEYTELIEALRMGADYGVEEESVGKLCADSAAAIEALQSEVNGLIADAGARIGKVEAEQPHWVSVEKRLPDKAGEYLVAYHPCHWDFVKKDVKVGIDSFRGKSAWAKKKYQRVTHWMPLPSPPVNKKFTK